MSIIYLNDNGGTKVELFGFSFTIEKMDCDLARLTFDDGLAVEIPSSGTHVLAFNILEAIEKTGRLDKWALRKKVASLKEACLAVEVKILRMKEEFRKTEDELYLTISTLGLIDNNKFHDERVLTRYELDGKTWVWNNSDPDLMPTIVYLGRVEREKGAI